MLRGIHPLLGPELLRALRQLGHGDEIVIEFPHVYIYMFEGEAFQEPGSGCSQVGKLIFRGVHSWELPDLELEDEEDSFDVWSGSIWVNGEPHPVV